MSIKNRYEKLEQSIVRDEKFVWTILSYVTVFIIFVNMNTVHSPALGMVVSFIFLLINALFLGSAFFDTEERFLRIAFGSFVLVAIIGIVGWTVLIIYNLDTIRSTIVLCIVNAISSITNRLGHYTFSIEFAREASSV